MTALTAVLLCSAASHYERDREEADNSTDLPFPGLTDGSEAEWDDLWCSYLEWVRDLSAEDFQRERAELDDLDAAMRARQEANQAASLPARLDAPSTPEPTETLDRIERQPDRQPAAGKPPPTTVTVLQHGQHLEDHPSWTPYSRDEW